MSEKQTKSAVVCDGKEHACTCGHDHSHEHSHEHNHTHDHTHDSHAHSCACETTQDDNGAPHGCACCGDHGEADPEEQKRELWKIGGAAGLLALGLLLPVPQPVQLALFLLSYVLVGWNVLRTAAWNITHGEIFDENFLMAIASLGAIAIGDHPEAVAVMLLYSLGELLQSKAVDSSRRSIRNLMNVRPDRATVLERGELIVREAEAVAVGEMIVVRPGEKIPLDGTVREGTSLLDTSALTGESIPREITVGDSALAGCLNQNGVLHIAVTKPFGESTASKILELVENAGANKAKSEQFITRFARIYTPVVVFAAVALAVIPPLLGLGGWSEYIHRALNFLVISCPCALIISVPLSFFAGIGCASKNGILVKGGNYLELLGKAEIAAFDKTGTLTRGKFSVTELRSAQGVSQEELLHYAACAESGSNHPLAQSILEAYGKRIPSGELSHAAEEAGHGVAVTWNGRRILAGKAAYLIKNGVSMTETAATATVIYVAVDGVYQGALLLADTLKPDCKSAMAALRALGIRQTVMLTGDRSDVAALVAKEAGVDIVRAELLPDEKLTELNALRPGLSSKGILLYAGDGINDAPVLAGADVGIAMGGLGADAAMEAADVVIMSDEPSKIALGIRISRRTVSIARQNIALAFAVKLLVLGLNVAFPLPLWTAIIADVGVCLLAVLNSLRAMRV